MENSSILFFTNCELGQASIILAVAHEFLLRPSYSVHIASFPSLAPDVDILNERAKMLASATTTATFHPINGPSMVDVYSHTPVFLDHFDYHQIGFRGASQAFNQFIPMLMNPWDGSQFVAIYRDCVDIIKKVRPAMVVLDPLFVIGLDACRVLRWPHVVLSPNTAKDLAPQPWLANLWKYPVLCSGYPYPVPWYLIPLNIFLTIKIALIIMGNQRVRKLRDYRNKHGIPGPNPLFASPPGDKTPYLLVTTPAADFPCFVPQNFTLCGPIVRPCAPIAQESPQLAAWLSLRPTVLVNMGSHVTCSPEQERQFAEGFRMLLDKRRDVQILWKLKRRGERQESALDCLREAIEGNRVRIESWLSVEPICVLLSGQVKCMIHHGGSNSYHEAVRAGVPQIVLPTWFDTYDFAHRAEFRGIGVWGNRNTAPAVKGVDLGKALIRVLASEESIGMADRAKKVVTQLEGEGRTIACEKIVDLIRSQKDENKSSVSLTRQ
ncbi:UDP-glucoronosyl and UDP-glucosyl transferase family protein [Aspergillus steynii IBT 23096]|uniref:UDP-glucoronosyl and UDP-glucosyl transferase family protein n=1 Tax=Aspergillus steynii IBT 23096 TaxID=1392250 RepID=A0A2I2G4Z4_9EURO|nr:UDP-glucoronosyl and UDP-glucosyl transferase family protein [Aspergillus steynii IBT 23096]PLB47923.1 UDP-glucoronosyl and UDP-glucosyl transferase family protein [Aspergillus steynii IBT 23096]